MRCTQIDDLTKLQRISQSVEKMCYSKNDFDKTRDN